MGYAGDLMLLFDERREAQYRLFGIDSVITDLGRPMPPFLRERKRAGAWKVLGFAESGYFDIVGAPVAFVGSNARARGVCERWLNGPLVEAKQHVRLALTETADLPPRRIKDRFAELPAPAELPPPVRGRVLEQSRNGEIYRARVELESPGFLLFKMGFHPDWVATVDKTARRCVELSPFFVGVPLGPGTHDVELEYRPGSSKQILLLLGLAGVLLALWVERILR